MLDDSLRTQILRILLRWPQIDKAVLYGSRTGQSHSRTSDIDIALFGRNLSSRDMSLIRDALENEVKTPLKFDVIHFDTISKKELKEDILKDGINLYESQTH